MSGSGSMKIRFGAASRPIMRTPTVPPSSATREDHILGAGLQMLPCCGHFLIAYDNLSRVEIVGCNSGIDWSVLHEVDSVRLLTESGGDVMIPLEEYRRAVFAFADEIEQFYRESKPKKIPADEFAKNGYLAFWEEWKNLRNHEQGGTQ